MSNISKTKCRNLVGFTDSMQHGNRSFSNVIKGLEKRFSSWVSGPLIA